MSQLLPLALPVCCVPFGAFGKVFLEITQFHNFQLQRGVYNIRAKIFFTYTPCVPAIFFGPSFTIAREHLHTCSAVYHICLTMSKRRRTSAGFAAARPIDKQLISISLDDISATQQTTVLLAPSSACTVLGIRWSFFIEGNAGTISLPHDYR